MQERKKSPSGEAETYLSECASCGGQFPTFRAICSECEDAADPDGFRDGKKIVSPTTPAKSTSESALVGSPAASKSR
jgi:predicted amidophosphoribosyltransferase